MRFSDRSEAGRKLAEALVRFKNEPCVIYALPRGGVPVAFEVAKALRAPLDLVLVRKIGAPFQPELALGAIVDGEKPEIVLNEDVVAAYQPAEEMIQAATAKELKEIERRRFVYLSGHRPQSATGRVAIVIDDGLATGATAKAALRALRRHDPKRLILAVPVAPADTIAALRDEADEIVCLYEPDDFMAVGAFYSNFAQTEDQEVVCLLACARDWLPAQTA